MKKHSICVVIPYFGKWPFWIYCFLESCRANRDIDWLLYSDCGELQGCPPNVRIIECSFEAYCNRIADVLGIEFKPVLTYKLCDVKPALGLIHADELTGYDFWAFGDIDLVYGDLRATFTTEHLMRYDLISTHSRRISGHFCLLRNTDEMRKAFMRVKGWRIKLEGQEHTAFDESGFSKLFLRHKNSPRWIRCLAAMIDPWLKRALFVEAYTTPNGKILWVDSSRAYPTEWYWHNGRISNDKSPEGNYPYFHFMVWKKSWAIPETSLRPSAQSRLVFTVDGIEEKAAPCAG